MGFLGWVILGLIFIAFAFWGLDSYLQSSVIDYAASVNDVEISTRQHNNAYQRLVERLRENLGNDYERAGFDEQTLKSSALKRLIDDELLIQAADSAGFAASDQLVAAEINAVDAFRKDGQFSKEQYRKVLSYQGMSPAQFEWELQREVIANQLKSGIALTAVTTEENISRIFRLEGQQRRFDYLLLPPGSVADQVTVSDDDLDKYYSQHGNEFMTREQAKVQYIELNAAELQLDVDVDDAEIEALYEAQAERFVIPEERRARHILVSTPAADEEAVNAARSKALEIVGRLDAGEDFAVVAAEMSDDPASATSGGDLGFFGPGVMTPKFEEAVFAMNVGERSKPVQTSFGFHVIELLEIRPEERTPLASVREDLARELQTEARADLFYEKSDMAANLAFEQADSLQGVAEALGLDILESGWIGRDGGPGIGGNDDIVEAIYNDDVLQNGNNSTLIEIGENHVVVLRVLEHQEAKQQLLENVRENVSNAVKTQKIRELLEAKGREYLAGLEQGDTVLADIASAQGLTVEQSPLITRNASSLDRSIIQQVFSLQPPRAGKPVFDGFALSNGDYSIIALHEVQDGSFETLTQEQRTQALRGLNRTLGAADVHMVMSELERKASIDIPDDSDQ
jgi:peptidyl-prolyl cis-trans isomerase D